MSDRFVVTIGREFGSGGLEVGKKLAEKLNIKFYDKELLSVAAKESGFSESIFEKADEKPTNSFLYSVVMGAYPMNSLFFQNNDLLTNDKLFNLQSNAIRNIVKGESCVIVGRCSDYVLREEKKLIRVYLRADMEFRKKRILATYPEVTEKDVESYILKTDKKRASYYSYYTGNVWDCVKNYDIVINTSKIGIDNAVNEIESYAQMINN